MDMKDIKHAKTFAGLPKNCIIGDFGIAWEDGKVYRCIERGKWTEFGGDTTQTQYCVTFHIETKSSEVWVDVTSPATQIAAPDEPSKEGYTFEGWNTKEDGSGSTITFPYAVSGDIDLYAIFEEIVPTVIYDDDVTPTQNGVLIDLDEVPLTTENDFAEGDIVNVTLGELTIASEVTAGIAEFEGEQHAYIGNLHLIGSEYEDTGEGYLVAMFAEGSLFATFTTDIEGITDYIDQTVTLTIKVTEA